MDLHDDAGEIRVTMKTSRIESPAGLVVHVNANGSIRRMEHGDVVLNLFPGS